MSRLRRAGSRSGCRTRCTVSPASGVAVRGSRGIMTDTTEREPTKLSLRPGKLELKKTVETGQVRQSFSHGRSKTVKVEVKRKRPFTPDTGGPPRTARPGGAAGANRQARGRGAQE